MTPRALTQMRVVAFAPALARAPTPARRSSGRKLSGNSSVRILEVTGADRRRLGARLWGEPVEIVSERAPESARVEPTPKIKSTGARPRPAAAATAASPRGFGHRRPE